jgi:hypothetical protein
MRKRLETQTLTGAWSASSAGIPIAVPRIGMITRQAITVEITPSATLDGANQPDGIFRVIQNLRLVGGNGSYFNLPGDAGGQGGTLLHYLNRHQMGFAGHISGDVTAPQHTYVPVSFYYHPGSRPSWGGRDNPFDMTSFIPAAHESVLNLEWVTGPNTLLDDTVTITSAVMRVSNYFITGTDEELRAEVARQRVALPAFAGGVPTGMMPSWQTLTYGPTAAASDYSLEHNIPGGGYLRGIYILNQDATATRSVRADDQITGVKVIMPDHDPIKVYTDFLTNMQDFGSSLSADEAADDFGRHAPGGLIFLDLRPHGNPDYGFNLEGVTEAKLAVTVSEYAAGDDQLILFDKVKPYFGLLGS